MPFVMVPVPEEHVFETMQFLVRLAARSSLKPWDEGSIEEFFRQADEPTRTMLSITARGVLAGEETTAGDLATGMELQLRDLAPILRGIEAQWKEMRKVPLYESRDVTKLRPSGKPWTIRTFVMPEEVAVMVRDAEQRVHAMEPNPLAGTPG